jgi:hypothetical protein
MSVSGLTLRPRDDKLIAPQRMLSRGVDCGGVSLSEIAETPRTLEPEVSMQAA